MQEQVFTHDFPSGLHRDVLISPTGNIVWEQPWQHNVVVEGIHSLLAALIKGDSQGKTLNYWVVGTGDLSWDIEPNCPPDDLRRNLTKLVNETGRKPISADQIKFVGGALTKQLEIQIDFTISDFPAELSKQDLQLREFGLFAGGSDQRESGTLINHRVHPRIDMQPGFTLQRTLRLTF